MDIIREKFFSQPCHALAQEEFGKIPTQPFAFWIKKSERDEYSRGRVLEAYAFSKKGMDTGDNNFFIRYWHEINLCEFSKFDVTADKWVPYNKGGDYRKWYGNKELVLRFECAGAELRKRRKNITKNRT